MGYVDGMNVYECVRGMAIMAADPLGFWTGPARQRSPRAQVCAEADMDPIEPLADRIRLNAGEALGPKGWLKDVDGSDVNSYIDIRKDKPYTVPNTIYILRGDIGFGIWPLYYRAGQSASGYKSQGYHVVDNKQARAEAIRAAFGAESIHGLEFWGHGENGELVGYGMPGEAETLKPAFDFSMYYVNSNEVSVKYKLAILRLFACEAGRGGWRSLVSGTGQYYAPRGTIIPLDPWHDREGEGKTKRKSKKL